jgi:hypothetical protein
MPSLNRRDALKWITGSAAGTLAVTPAIAAPGETEPAPLAWPTRHPIHDPDFSKPLSGPWPRVMTDAELNLTKVLADLILPKDANGPAASEVGVPEFINEWISAPYDEQREDGEIVRGGLAWINTASFKRFTKPFDQASVSEQTQLLDSICDASTAKAEDAVGVAFFKKFRHLVIGGYYTHRSTWKHLGYIGNVTLAGAYPGVPDEVIKKLGLEDVA